MIKKVFLILVLIIFAFAITASAKEVAACSKPPECKCEKGDPGPAGPQGPKGDLGSGCSKIILAKVAIWQEGPFYRVVRANGSYDVEKDEYSTRWMEFRPRTNDCIVGLVQKFKKNDLLSDTEFRNLGVVRLTIIDLVNLTGEVWLVGPIARPQVAIVFLEENKAIAVGLNKMYQPYIIVETDLQSRNKGMTLKMFLDEEGVKAVRDMMDSFLEE